MSRFSGDWLSLRERHDARARAAAEPSRLVATLAARLGAGGVANIIDLGSGTGSNLRHLGPRLDLDQNWTLVDKDGQLLARVGQACQRWARERGWAVQSNGGSFILSNGQYRLVVQQRRHDLQDLDGLALSQYNLVTGSALLDLVSRAWLAKLAVAAREHALAVHFVLSADGRLRWTPAHEMDRRVAGLFHRDLKRDKGFGPAAGIAASTRLANLLAGHGYAVTEADSDWTIAPTDTAMLAAMVGFVSEAARNQAPQDRRISAWAAARRRQLRRGMLRLAVGHRDLLALM